MIKLHKHHFHLIKDFFILSGSIALAVVLHRTGAVYWLISRSQELRVIGTFVSGFFFTSIITIAPAGVALAEIAKTTSVFWTAFFGAVGAALGDLVIFKFVRDQVSEDLKFLLEMFPRPRRYRAIVHKRLFRWLWPLLGAIVIASPLPDELGVSLLGLTKVKTRYFLLISFSFNFLGILALGVLAR